MIVKWIERKFYVFMSIYLLHTVYVCAIDYDSSTLTQSNNVNDLKSSNVEQNLLCTHPVFPCYYYTCINDKTNVNNVKEFKCAAGLIFDQDSQKCVWALPWKRCTGNEDDAIILKTTIKNEYSNNHFEDSNLKSETYQSPDQLQTDSHTANYKDRNLINVLSGANVPRTYVNSFEMMSKNVQNELIAKNEPKQFEDLKMDGRVQVDSAEDLANLTLGKRDSFELSDEDGDADFIQEPDRYAYIIVPIKVSKTHKLPDIDLLKKKTIKQKVNKQKIKAKEARNFEEAFKYKKVCYVTNWSQYRKYPAQFVPENVDPFLCTHLIYAFAYIDNVTLTVRTIEENDEEMYRRINDLKFKNPKLKTMLAIGGWNMASKEFSKMVKLRETREKFINHLINFLRFYEFDGVDLDWEFPGERGGSPDDKANFAIFLKEFRQAINEELIDEDKESLILSAAVGAGRRRVELGYDIKAMVKELDFVNMMTFDFHGSWDETTGLNAPLYASDSDDENNMENNQDSSVSYWIKNGCPPHKIVLGLPAYGRTFALENPRTHGLNAKSSKNGQTSGNYTQTPGFLSYYEICQLKKKYNWTTVWQSQSKSHYMYRDNDWISYDDIKSFHLRTAYVVAKKLGGIFIWSIDMDDFSGKFCDLGAYPLIKNSMSLLMDYMPEYYSSNVNAPSKSMPKSYSNKKLPSASKTNHQTKIFYILKDDYLNSAPLQTTYRTIEKNFDLLKQNRIRDDLLLLLTQQPQKFVSFNLPDTFNCTNKQNGLHRDPFDCTKYYYCDQNSEKFANQNIQFNPYLKSIAKDHLIQTKAYTCPDKSVFNMDGCYCDKILAEKSSCHYLSDTYCDLARYKEEDKTYA